MLFPGIFIFKIFSENSPELSDIEETGNQQNHALLITSFPLNLYHYIKSTIYSISIVIQLHFK